jgi:hypothetical protein
MTPPGTALLRPLWASSPQDCWVADDSAIVHHFNGQGWDMFTLANMNGVNALWGTSPTDVWAFGDGSMHWNGATWSAIPLLGAMTVRIYGAWGSASDDVWVAGVIVNGIDQTAIVLHWDGQAWTPSDAGSDSSIAVGGFGRNDQWIVGFEGEVLHRRR